MKQLGSFILCCFFWSPLALALLQSAATPAPHPPPPSQNTCSTFCNEWSPDYPSTCGAPEVSHKRLCTTSCSNGGGGQVSERLCLPLANYTPMNYLSGSFDNVESETFKSTVPCADQWWVDITTTILYQGSFANISSLSSEECRK